MVKYDYPSQEACCGATANRVISDHMHLETDDYMTYVACRLPIKYALREVDE